MTLARTLSLALVLASISFSVEARTRHQDETPQPFDRHAVTEIGSRMFITESRVMKVSGLKQIRKKHERRFRSRVADYSGHAEPQLLPHPSGCPARAFCGCGASVEVFGHSVRELWLASNWFRFPRAAPAPGMVAVRRHHVFVIREVRDDNMVLAYDANSGGRQTRIHLRSLAGYTVVNPRGSRYAAAR